MYFFSPHRIHLMLTHGVPHAYLFGSILFINYVLPIQHICLKFPNIHNQLYADDLHIYT